MVNESQTRKPVDQNKILGATYIAEFFTEVKALTEQYANYKNVYLELEYNSKLEGGKIDTDQVNNGKIAVNNIKFVANKVYIHFLTLRTVLSLDKQVSEPIVESYNKIVNPATALPDCKDIELFVVEMNTLLVRDIVKNLLETSQDILNSLYPR